MNLFQKIDFNKVKHINILIKVFLHSEKWKLTQYLKEIAFKDTYVSTARLGNLLLDTTGVFDYSDFKVNGAMSNVNLLDTDVPKVGTISFSYAEVV